MANLEWLVWFARKTKGKVADVTRLAVEQNPYLFTPDAPVECRCVTKNGKRQPTFGCPVHSPFSPDTPAGDDTVFELLVGLGVPGSLAGAAEDRILGVARRQAEATSGGVTTDGLRAEQVESFMGWLSSRLIDPENDYAAIEQRVRLFALSMTPPAPATEGLREALVWLIDHSIPTHTPTCAMQIDDDAPCICGVSDQYERILALSTTPPAPPDGGGS
jgi:hypothetical protein